MVETVTTHYSWTKPEVTKSASTWGGFLNNDLDGIDAQVWGITNNPSGTTFAYGVTVGGGLGVTGGVTVGGGLGVTGAVTCNGFTNYSGYTATQASGASNAYFAMHNNAGTPMGYLYWYPPSNQIVLNNQTGGGQLTINVDGSVSTSGAFHTLAISSTAVSCSSISCSGSATFGGFSSVGSASISGTLTLGAGGNLNVTNGWMAATGTLSRNGISGSNGVDQYNHYWTGSQNRLYLNNSDWGTIQTTSDYRMKKNIATLPSMWDRVKSLRPISYSIRDWTPPASVEHQRKIGAGPLVVGNDIEQWGFLAHELQETLVESAANGVKDDPVHVQSPNPFTVIAALAKALQEAMTRIEALEAK